jgi:hypothetical protein
MARPVAYPPCALLTKRHRRESTERTFNLSPHQSTVGKSLEKEPQVKESFQKKIDLGPCGAVTLHVSADRKRLLLEFETEPEGFDKTGLNSFIDALKKIRDRMQR